MRRLPGGRAKVKRGDGERHDPQGPDHPGPTGRAQDRMAERQDGNESSVMLDRQDPDVFVPCGLEADLFQWTAADSGSGCPRFDEGGIMISVEWSGILEISPP